MTDKRSDESLKKKYKYIDDYNRVHYTRHEVKLRLDEEDRLQAILKRKKISFNQFIILCINKEKDAEK